MSDLLKDILDHAKQEYPKESCGLIVSLNGNDTYFPCTNVATERHKEFVINPEDYSNAEDLGDIKKIVHSHPTSNPTPSQNDLVSIEATKLPWIIINPLTEQWTETTPTGYIAHLIGREYGYGVLDCYSLIKDYYKTECGITLSDYARKGSHEDDVKNYLTNLEREGFYKVGGLEKHDLILMFGGSHAAVYLGDNQILQHCHRRLSSRDVYGGYWAKNTVGFYRHKDLTKTEI